MSISLAISVLLLVVAASAQQPVGTSSRLAANLLLTLPAQCSLHVHVHVRPYGQNVVQQCMHESIVFSNHCVLVQVKDTDHFAIVGADNTFQLGCDTFYPAIFNQ